ncbi:MAG: arginase family protein [Planctomycetes bacterium]|nr:arginase family protein [Planctomycetota bacterium]
MTKPTRRPTTLRLLMPQWQGGNNPVPYPLGARLLAWLAPAGDAPLVEVPVAEYDGSEPALDGGIVWREAVGKQLRAARHIIDAYEPDRVIVFGGDCLVSQAPFAYCNQRYGGELGVLWIDAHPDVTTPREFAHAHAMVLGHLLGEGDPELAATVERPLDPRRVLIAGVDSVTSQENEVIGRLGISRLPSSDLAASSQSVLAWIRDHDIRHLAIHLDLDVLDPRHFRSLLFNNPDGTTVDAPAGRLTLPQVTRLITEVAAATEVVGFSIAEHMPWDDINLKRMLDSFSFLQ